MLAVRRGETSRVRVVLVTAAVLLGVSVVTAVDVRSSVEVVTVTPVADGAAQPAL